MRNVYIVLVPLCFGLTSGFIVPSGVQEILTDLEVSSDSISNSASKTRSLLHLESKNISQLYVTNINATITLENTNDSLYKDLYEHSQPKDVDVKERSFIYINQRIRKPLRNRFYDNPSQQDHIKDNTHRKYYLSNINNTPPRQFSFGYQGEKNDNIHLEISDKPDHRCHNKLRNKIKQYPDTNSKQMTDKQVSTAQRKYLKPSKAPILRTDFKHNDDRLYRPDNNLLSYIPPNLQKSKNGYILLTPSEIQNANPVGIPNVIHSDTVNNVKKIANEEDFILDFGKKIDQNIVSNNKLKQDNFKQRNDKEASKNKTDRGEGNQPTNSNQNIIKFCRDCIKKARKHKLSSRLHFEKICKCGPKLFLRELDKQ